MDANPAVEQNKEQESTAEDYAYNDWQLDKATWDVIAQQVP